MAGGGKDGRHGDVRLEASEVRAVERSSSLASNSELPRLLTTSSDSDNALPQDERVDRVHRWRARLPGLAGPAVPVRSAEPSQHQPPDAARLSRPPTSARFIRLCPRPLPAPVLPCRLVLAYSCASCGDSRPQLYAFSVPGLCTGAGKWGGAERLRAVAADCAGRADRAGPEAARGRAVVAQRAQAAGSMPVNLTPPTTASSLAASRKVMPRTDNVERAAAAALNPSQL